MSLGRGRSGRLVVQGVGVTVGEGDGVGTLVGRGVLLGVAELAGVVRADGLGVTCEVGSGVAGDREVPGGVDGCSVGTPTTAGDAGLNST
jgi:hypothetical protein